MPSDISSIVFAPSGHIREEDPDRFGSSHPPASRRQDESADLSRGDRGFAGSPQREVHRIHRSLRPARGAAEPCGERGAGSALVQERGEAHGDHALAPDPQRYSRRRGSRVGQMTGEAQPGRMRTLLEHVARALVDDPSAVVVTEELDGDFTKLHLQVAEPDVGKVIGRGGRIAKAIRALLKVMATRDGTKVNLEID